MAMMAGRNLIAALAGLALFIPGAASAHRMPEVDITVTTSEVEAGEVAVFTFRFHAADVLKVLGRDRDIEVDLSDPKLLAQLAVKAEERVRLEGGVLDYFGGEADRNAVFLFYTAKPDAQITDASVLSSVYRSWTNRVNDERSGETVTKLFTQGGEIRGHKH